MIRIKSYFDRVSLKLSLLMFTMIIAMAFQIINQEAAAVTPTCDAWIDYYVDVDGNNGTCTVGLGATDFLNGTGVAECTLSKSGNINCKCEGVHTTPLESALIFNKEDQCCVTIGTDEPILSDKTHGLATPSGIVNATCQIKK